VLNHHTSIPILLQGGEGRFEREDSVFMKLLAMRSYKHLAAMFREYKAVNGEELLAAMKFDCDKDYFHLLNTMGRNCCHVLLLSAVLTCKQK